MQKVHLWDLKVFETIFAVCATLQWHFILHH